jgi:hypothetical protein
VTWSLPYAVNIIQPKCEIKGERQGHSTWPWRFRKHQGIDGPVCTANLKRLANMNAQCTTFYPPLSWVQLLRRGYHLIQDIPRCSASRRAPTKSPSFAEFRGQAPAGLRGVRAGELEAFGVLRCGH